MAASSAGVGMSRLCPVCWLPLREGLCPRRSIHPVVQADLFAEPSQEVELPVYGLSSHLVAAYTMEADL